MLKYQNHELLLGMASIFALVAVNACALGSFDRLKRGYGSSLLPWRVAALSGASCAR